MKPENQAPKALKVKAWKMMSELVRRKYADDNGDCECYTCGKTLPWRHIQAGHGISGRGNFILFLEEVIKPQCSTCNVMRGGDYNHFIPKLIEEYGLGTFTEWVYDSRKPFKRTKKDYIALIHELEARLVDLEG